MFNTLAYAHTHTHKYTYVRIYAHEYTCIHTQEVDTIFQKVLHEIEKHHGTQDDSGCRLL